MIKKKKIKTKKSTSSRSSQKTSAQKSGIVPLGDRVLVKPLSQEELGRTTSFGIIIPETVDKKKPDQGIVIAVGPGKRNDRGERMTPDVKPGDRIYFSKPWDEPQKIDGVDYYFIAEADILAVVRK